MAAPNHEELPMTLHISDGPFDTLQETFRLLCSGPKPLAIEGREVPGLPRREIPLDELRAILLHPSTRYSTRDAAMSYLLAVAQKRGGTATVGLAGVLLFGLRRALGPLCAVCPERSADLEAEALVGLLEAIAATEADRPRLAARLCWLARNRAKRLLEAEMVLRGPHRAHPDAKAPRLPCAHPDLVLANAVVQQVILAEDAALIGDTRLGQLTLDQSAAALGIAPAAARKRRWRAERRLTTWLRSDDYESSVFVQSGRRDPYLRDSGRPRSGTSRQTPRRDGPCS
jgi:hypothetical protein